MYKDEYYEKRGVKMTEENRKRILEIEEAWSKALKLFYTFDEDFPLPDGRAWNIYGIENCTLGETY